MATQVAGESAARTLPARVSTHFDPSELPSRCALLGEEFTGSQNLLSRYGAGNAFAPECPASSSANASNLYSLFSITAMS